MQALPFDLTPPSPLSDAASPSRMFAPREQSSNTFDDHLQRASGPRSNETRNTQAGNRRDNERDAAAGNAKQPPPSNQAAKPTSAEANDDQRADVTDDYAASDSVADKSASDEAVDPQGMCPTPPMADANVAQNGQAGEVTAAKANSENEKSTDEKAEAESVLDPLAKTAKKSIAAAKPILASATARKQAQAANAVAKEAASEGKADGAKEGSEAKAAVTADAEAVAETQAGDAKTDPSIKPTVDATKAIASHDQASTKGSKTDGKEAADQPDSTAAEKVGATESEEKASAEKDDSKNAAPSSDRRGSKQRASADDAAPVQQVAMEHKVAEIARPTSLVAPLTPAAAPTTADSPRAETADRAASRATGVASSAPAATSNSKPQSTPQNAPTSSLSDPRAPPSVATKSVGRSEAASGLNEIDRVRFVQRVARAVQTAGDRGGEIRLRLSPSELGSLKLEVVVRNGTMSARVEAETPTARALLLDNLPALREKLAEQNIKIDRFDVDLSGGSSGSLSDRTADNTDLRGQREAAALRNNKPSVATVGDSSKPSAPQSRVFRDGSLNVIV